MNDTKPMPARRLPLDNRFPNPALLLLLKRPHSGPEIMLAMRAQGLRFTSSQLHAHVEAGHVSFVGHGKFLVFCLPGGEDEARAKRSKTLAGGRIARDRKAEADAENTKADAESGKTDAEPLPEPAQEPTTAPAPRPATAPRSTPKASPPKKREVIANADATKTTDATKATHDKREARTDALHDALAGFRAEIAETMKQARAVEAQRDELRMRARALDEVLGVMQSKVLRLVMARDRVQAILDAQEAAPVLSLDDFERIHLGATTPSDATPDAMTDAAPTPNASAPTTNAATCEATHAQDGVQDEAPIRTIASEPARALHPAPKAPPAPKPAPTHNPDAKAPTPRREQPAQRSNSDCVELSRDMQTPDGKTCAVTFTQSREGCTVLRPGVFVDWLDRNGHPNGEKIQGRLGELWDRFCSSEPGALARTHAPRRPPMR